MMKVRLGRAASLLLGLLLSTGCAGRQANPATLAPDTLYAQATTAFEAKNYGRAIRLLDVFVQQHVGDPRAPQARLYLAQSEAARKNYLTAATHYQRLVTDFPSSPLALDARFGMCEAYYRLSPRPALDQEYTLGAIAHCESLAQYYPSTPQAATATGYVADMRVKLAQKAYDNGMFYLKRRLYDAAVVYFNEVLTDFAQTGVAPAALQRLAETYTRVGYVEEAAEARARLLRDYPDSPEAAAVRVADGSGSGTSEAQPVRD